jgi:hypothetical protein
MRGHRFFAASAVMTGSAAWVASALWQSWQRITNDQAE